MRRILKATAIFGGTLCIVNTSYASITYLHSNPMGSMIAATDESGAQVWIKRYTPFGIESRIGELQDSGSNHGFATHEFDAETSLVYMRARYYDPFIGRFYSSDVVEDGFNYYAYSANNPINFYDPSGEVKDWGALFTQGVGTVAGFAGMLTGMGAIAGGIIGAAAPEGISTLAGLGVASFGLTTFVLSADATKENMWGAWNNIRETDYPRPSSIKTETAYLLGLDSSSPVYSAVYDATSLATGLYQPSNIVKLPSYLDTVGDIDTTLETSNHMYNSYESIGGSMGWNYSSWETGFGYGSSSWGSSSSFGSSSWSYDTNYSY